MDALLMSRKPNGLFYVVAAPDEATFHLNLLSNPAHSYITREDDLITVMAENLFCTYKIMKEDKGRGTCQASKVYEITSHEAQRHARSLRS